MDRIGNEKGFSMLELMMGLLIMTILITAVVSVGSISVQKSRNSVIVRDLNMYINAAEIYMLEEVGTGISIEGFNKHLKGSYKFNGIYSEKINAWKNNYVIYRSSDANYGSPGVIAVYSDVDVDAQVDIDRARNHIDGAVYYFRGEVSKCISHGYDPKPEQIVDVILMFGEQDEGFRCGNLPVYNY